MKVTRTARIATATLLVAGLTSAAGSGCSGRPPGTTGPSTLTLWTDVLRAPALMSVSAQKSDGSYDGSKPTLGDPAGVEFAAALKAWGAEGIQNPNITPDIAATSFAQGESPFFISGPWNIGAIKKASVKYAIDPLPTAGRDAAKPFLISLITSLATVVLGAMAAYTSFRMRFLGRPIGLLALILIQMFPRFLAVVGLLSFIATMGEYVLASIMLTGPSRQTLAVGLYSFVSQAFANNWSIFVAGAVLAAVPVMFLLLQKYPVGGLTAGSVK